MNKQSMRMILGCCLSALTLSMAQAVHAAAPTPAEVTATLKRSADWQLASPSGIDTRDWIIAPLYDGLLRVATTTGDAKYLARVIQFGKQSGWMPGGRVYHADDHAVGHAWLDVYQMDRTGKERLAPIQERFDFILAHPITEVLTFGTKPATPGISVTHRWSWCDALYMAPPTLTRLHTATGDKKYLEFLDREYRATYDQLYDTNAHLFYRDATFFNKKTPGGKKTFWSRGNGWVYGGLALVLEQLPADHPTRGFYEKLFREMTASLLAAQQSDGLWRPSLLDPDQVPVGETSGSGFFVFGLAWGVNHGLLDRETHWPAVLRGWAGLMTRIKPDGYVGYVQKVGDAPAALGPDSKQDYGTGAFLLAGSEVLRGLGGAAKTEPAALYAAAEQVLAAEAKTPRAYARLVPERKDDVAWENDKVAFRAYGPALRADIVDSGIDIWCKRVAYPILDKWYHQELSQNLSYHQDHGEGYDGFKVDDTRGCGGLGLWIDGKIVTSDTYKSATVYWTSPDRAEFSTLYQYPVKVDGQPLYEHRLTRLRLGERLFEVTAHFATNASRWAKPLVNLPHEVVIGLVMQNDGAEITLNPTNGVAAIRDTMNDKALFTGLTIEASRVVRMAQLPANPAPRKGEHAVVFTRPDAQGKVSYRAGFAWSADGDITTPEQWVNYLEAIATRP